MQFIRRILFYILIVKYIAQVLTLNDGENTNTDVAVHDITSSMCDSSNCIMKCCPFGKYLNKKLIIINRKGKTKKIHKRICDKFEESRNISSLEKDYHIFFSRPNLSAFNVKSDIFETNENFMLLSVDVSNLSSYNLHLTEDSELYLEMPNAYNRWTRITNDMFCFDFKIYKNTTLTPGIWVLFPNSFPEPRRTSDTLVTIAMFVSCFFLLVVLVVYALLQELRNLCGMILMAYMASQFGAFLLLAVMRMYQKNSKICIGFTCSIYFMFLASFCWMNVMSCDIWWTFRGYAKARPIHRRGEKFKFLMYCLYAWGLPLAMAIGLAVLNETDMKEVSWFITPKIPENGCFIDGGEKFLYLYIPMLILILCNWIFYMMTAFNIWRLNRGTAVLDSAAAGTPQAHRTHRHRFLVYLKLSIVMGLNWVLEVISYMYPGEQIWFITDFYNILIGVSIFLIFVCKRNIFKKLVKLYLRYRKQNWGPSRLDMRSTTSTTDSSVTSQETQTLQVCFNPKGPYDNMKSS